ncbi:MAG: hypothetical protein SGJ11_17795 [Phycisphaerae bacterium]|nr:hypothetical protein [Phycisphaerae bacterium]
MSPAPEPVSRSADAPTRPTAEPDPPRTLPTADIILVFGGLTFLHTAVLWGLQRNFQWSSSTVNGAMVGGLVAYACVLASIMALQPWKPRPMAAWSVLWMGSTTIRLLLTPLALFSVYFATLLPGTAVLLGGSAAFFVAIAAETVVIARSVLQSKPSSS